MGWVWGRPLLFGSSANFGGGRAAGVGRCGAGLCARHRGSWARLGRPPLCARFGAPGRNGAGAEPGGERMDGFGAVRRCRAGRPFALPRGPNAAKGIRKARKG